jgi:hypothetical protein
MSFLLQKQANLSKSSKPVLFPQTCNLWSSRPELNRKAQFPTNLILIGQIKKKIIQKIYQSKKKK